MKNIAPILLLLSLSGCGLIFGSAAWERRKAVMPQLNPITLSVQDQMARDGNPPADLEAALGQSLPAILPSGGRLERRGPETIGEYILTIPNIDEQIAVRYVVTNGDLDLSFGYSSRFVGAVCDWYAAESDWTCIRY